MNDPMVVMIEDPGGKRSRVINIIAQSIRLCFCYVAISIFLLGYCIYNWDLWLKMDEWIDGLID